MNNQRGKYKLNNMTIKDILRSDQIRLELSHNNRIKADKAQSKANEANRSNKRPK